MDYILGTVEGMSYNEPEARYLQFFSDHISNALHQGDKDRFNRAIDQLFKELSQDREIDTIKQIGLAYVIGSFVCSEEVKDWFTNSDIGTCCSAELARLYHDKLQTRLLEIVGNMSESPE